MVAYMFTDASLSGDFTIGAFAYQVLCYRNFQSHFMGKVKEDFSNEKIIKSGLFDHPVEQPCIAEMKCIVLAFKDLSEQSYANEIKNIIVITDSLDSVRVLTNKVVKGKNKEENALALSEIEKAKEKFPLLEDIKYCHIKAHRVVDSRKYEIHRWADMESRKLLRGEVKATEGVIANLGSDEDFGEAELRQDTIIKNNIRIPVYKKDKNDKFLIDKEEVYTITYLHGARLKLRIVVNEYLTKQTIHLENPHIGYKDSILKAISEYKKTDVKIRENNTVRRKIRFDSLSCYSKQIRHNVKDYLLPINKEVRRDTLTQYGLIVEEKKTKQVSWWLTVLRKMFANGK